MLARKRGVPRAVFFRRMLEVFGRADGIGEECRRRTEQRRQETDRYFMTPEGQEQMRLAQQAFREMLVQKVLADINTLQYTTDDGDDALHRVPTHDPDDDV